MKQLTKFLLAFMICSLSIFTHTHISVAANSEVKLNSTSTYYNNITISTLSGQKISGSALILNDTDNIIKAIDDYNKAASDENDKIKNIDIIISRTFDFGDLYDAVSTDYFTNVEYIRCSSLTATTSIPEPEEQDEYEAYERFLASMCAGTKLDLFDNPSDYNFNGFNDITRQIIERLGQINCLIPYDNQLFLTAGEEFVQICMEHDGNCYIQFKNPSEYIDVDLLLSERNWIVPIVENTKEFNTYDISVTGIDDIRNKSPQNLKPIYYSKQIIEDKNCARYEIISILNVAYSNNAATETGRKVMTNQSYSYDVTYDEIIPLPNGVKEGYTFKYWKDKTGSKITHDTIVAQKNSSMTAFDTVILYPEFTANNYTISYDGNGVDCTEPSKSIAFDSKYGALPTLTKPGYTLSGWSIDKAGSNMITSETLLKRAKDHTIYAIWDAIKVTASLDAQGGENTISTVTLQTDEIVGYLPVPKRIGYTFTGWYTESEGGTKITSDTVMTADEIVAAQTSPITLYAQYTKNVHTVTYKLNGGTSTDDISTVEKAYNEAYGAFPTVKRDGYELKGWFIEDIGYVSETDTMPDRDVTITAMWDMLPNTVVNGTATVVDKVLYTFIANGGTCSETTREIAVGDKIGKLPVPTRAGYIFLGWFTQVSGGEQIDENYASSTSEPVSFYAQWKSDGSKEEIPSDGNVTPPTTETKPSDNSSNSTEDNSQKDSSVKKVSVAKVTKLKLKNIKTKKLKISYKKVSGAKYQIQIATNKKFKKATSRYTNKTTYTFKKLKKGKTYYVRVRAYKKANGVKYNGKWSTVKKIKIKK